MYSGPAVYGARAGRQVVAQRGCRLRRGWCWRRCPWCWRRCSGGFPGVADGGDWGRCCRRGSRSLGACRRCCPIRSTSGGRRGRPCRPWRVSAIHWPMAAQIVTLKNCGRLIHSPARFLVRSLLAIRSLHSAVRSSDRCWWIGGNTCALTSGIDREPITCRRRARALTQISWRWVCVVGRWASMRFARSMPRPGEV